jgi:hypothetical protein
MGEIALQRYRIESLLRVDAVEKVGGARLTSNYRIETSGSLNRRCVIGPCFESMLLACQSQNRFSTASVRGGRGSYIRTTSA